ncbi:MAG: hypothetical protein RIS35_471 [Pseudomonadota bacterium]|jgi:uncharacterized protein YjeT (DUF2065 family)
MGESLALAAGLVLIIEGLGPFLMPGQWRAAMTRIAGLRDGQIRFVGLAAVLLGLLLIWA